MCLKFYFSLKIHSSNVACMQIILISNFLQNVNKGDHFLNSMHILHCYIVVVAIHQLSYHALDGAIL